MPGDFNQSCEELRQENIELRAELAAERASRRVAEARLAAMRNWAMNEHTLQQLRRIHEEVAAYLRALEPSTYDFKVPD